MGWNGMGRTDGRTEWDGRNGTDGMGRTGRLAGRRLAGRLAGSTVGGDWRLAVTGRTAGLAGQNNGTEQ